MTWVLVFFVMLRDPPIYGGEYQTELGCLKAAKIQAPYWRKRYGNNLTSWKCVVEDDLAPKQLRGF